MKQDFKAFLKTTKGKLIVSCSALLLSWIFLILQFSGDLSAWLPNEARKTAMNRDIRKYKTEQQGQQAKLREIEALRKRYQDNIAESWQVRRDGDPAVILRQKIESAAKEVELSLENIGSVRTSNINNDLYFAEMDISYIGEAYEGETIKIYRAFDDGVYYMRGDHPRGKCFEARCVLKDIEK